MLVVNKIHECGTPYKITDLNSPLELRVLDTQTGIVDTVEYDSKMEIFGVYKYNKDNLVVVETSDIFLNFLVYLENVKSCYINKLDVDYTSGDTSVLDFGSFTLTCSHEKGSKAVFVHYAYISLFDSAFVLKLSKLNLSDSALTILDLLDKILEAYPDLLSRNSINIYSMSRCTKDYIKITIDLTERLKRFIVKARTLKC